MNTKTDLERAFEALRAKQELYNGYWEYYRGEHPLVYSTERLREVFRGLAVNFVENWCSLVVHVPLERLVLERLDVAGDPELSERLHELWDRLDLNLDADDVHECLLVTGEAFVVGWIGDDGEPEAFFNDSRLCHVFYDAENPRVVRYAAKWWRDEGNCTHLALYYLDRVEFYESAAGSLTGTGFELVQVVENPFGIVPVFHLRSGRGYGRSVLEDVIPLQAAINKLLADEMVAAEYGAFRQRWVISNADVTSLRNAPNEIWNLPAGDGMGQATAVGEFGQTQLGNYESSIERRIGALSAITRIPSHYFFRTSQPPSGEALMVMEAPLTKQIKRLQQRLIPVWQALGAFLLQAVGFDAPPSAIVPVYAEPATVQPRTEAEIRQLTVAAGVPLLTQLRREGWSAAALEQLLADQE